MPRTDTPKGIRPYVSMGVVDGYKSEKQVTTTCPFCESDERKFFINPETSQFQCKRGSCGVQGNATIFLREWLARCFDRETDYSHLLKDRKGISEASLLKWHVCINPITREWLIPGYNASGSVMTLYRYAIGKRVYATGGISNYLMGMDCVSPDCERIYVTEGPWDALAILPLLDSNESVIAISGANSFPKNCVDPELFEDRETIFMFDSDHPKGKNDPAGIVGVKACTKVFSENGIPGDSLGYLSWGKRGYDPKKPSGYDLRDHLNESGEALGDRLRAFRGLRDRILGIRKEWLREPKNDSAKPDLSPIPCDTYDRLLEAWKKALFWTEGLDLGLSVMLATTLSTKLIGEQLWVKIIGPPSSGKTTLLEGLAVCKKFVLSKDTIRGFYSGWRGDGEDNSIASLAENMTLAIKDGDTLLKSPNLSQILSEGRGLYDGAGRTHYRNDVSKDYEGHRMTWILCGTSSLREIDDSELGARFLDCVIMDGIDERFEKKVGMMAADQEIANMLMQSNGKAETRSNPYLMEAMRLTGGYVKHLRENDVDLISKISIGKSLSTFCNDLGKFVSLMRARPVKAVKGQPIDEEGGREFSPRLVKQFTRLSIALTVVLNRKSPDKEVLKRVNQISKDTARGITLDIAGLLYEVGQKGRSANGLGILTGVGENRARHLLGFMRSLKMVRQVVVAHNQKNYILTKSFRALYKKVMVDAEDK